MFLADTNREIYKLNDIFHISAKQHCQSDGDAKTGKFFNGVERICINSFSHTEEFTTFCVFSERNCLFLQRRKMQDGGNQKNTA
jgi:hypothetical protein